jgi:hypothetical protein
VLPLHYTPPGLVIYPVGCGAFIPPSVPAQCGLGCLCRAPLLSQLACMTTFLAKAKAGRKGQDLAKKGYRVPIMERWP